MRQCNCNSKTTNLDKCVDGQDRQFGLCFGIVHQVQIHQFLELNVVCLHILQDVRKQAADVFTYSHARNDLLDSVASCLAVFTIELLFEFVDFTCQMCVSAINAMFARLMYPFCL